MGEKLNVPATSNTNGQPQGKISSFGLPRLHSKIDISSDKFLLPKDKLSSPPSAVDGVDEELERDLRFLGCHLIQSAGILLKVPQVASASAQILYQRYFYCKSFVRNNFEEVAMACLVLASKIEEAPRRNRDVINVFHHIKQMARLKSQSSDKRPTPLLLDEAYVATKARVIKAERKVLKELGFVVHVKHPHKLITGYLRALELDSHKRIIQKAWLKNQRICKVPLPMEPRPWWELFKAEEEDIMEISRILLFQYQRTKCPSWRRLEQKIAELREKQRKERMKADETGTGTPSKEQNQNSTSGRHERTPEGRLGSPSVNKREKEKGKPREKSQLNGEVRERGDRDRGGSTRKAEERHRERKRSRTRSISSSSPPPRVKELPKRYMQSQALSSSSGDRRNEFKKRKRSRSPISPPSKSIAKSQKVKDDKEKKKKRPSPISPPRSSKSFKKQKRREREVKQALEEDRRKKIETKKSSKHR